MPSSRGRVAARASKPVALQPLSLPEADAAVLSWRDPAWPLFALLPVLILFLYSGWMYNALEHLDPWFYTGTFFHLPEFKSQWFPDRYYGDRLSWTLPGYLLHRLFNPIAARYVLHFGCYYLAIGCFYWLIRLAVPRAHALLITILFGAHGPLLIALGHDYVDAPAIAYYLPAAACAVQAGRSTAPSRWLFASGFFTACMIYSNIFMAVFLPSIALLYLYQVFGSFIRHRLLAQLRLASFFFAGLFAVTIPLSILHFRWEGNPWLLSTSIRFSRELITVANPWARKNWEWLSGAHWLVFPCVGFAAALILVLRGPAQPKSFPRLFALNLLLISAGYLATHAKNGSVLGLDYYMSCILPASFLALGSLLGAAENLLPRSRAWIPFLVLFTAILLSWGTRRLGLPIFPYSTSRWWFLAGLAGILILTFRPGRGGFAAAWTALLIANFGVTGHNLGNTHAFHSPAHMHEIYGRITSAVKAASRESGSSPMMFWFDYPGGPFRSEYTAINSSFLWHTTLLGDRFPEVSGKHLLRDSGKVAVLSSRLTPAEALSSAQQSLAPLGYLARPLKSLRVQSGSGGYQLIFLQLASLTPAAATP
ncbi:MAG: hypothetical protein FJW20_00325 [Acidimicrobiia bacterium]|nr:hypothetical protein [Acidimicrobiia bacterium]